MALRSLVESIGADLLAPPERHPAAAEAEGTARVVNGETMVQIDGAAIATPCATTVTVNDGDRVFVKIKGHRAVITGNEGSPAVDSQRAQAIESMAKSALEAQRYVEQTEDGLVIGNKVGGEWSGMRVVIDGDSFDIVDGGGDAVASYAAQHIRLGECLIALHEDGDGAAMNIFSGLGRVIVSASRYEQPPGEGGDVPQALPASLAIEEKSIRATVDVAGADGAKTAVGVEVGEEGTHFSGPVSFEGAVHFNGPVYVNGRLLE